MKKQIFVKIMVVVLIIAMLVPAFSLIISAATQTNISYSETNISIYNRSSFYQNSVTVYNQYNTLSAKEKSWLDKGGKDGILKSISAIETIYKVSKDSEFSKNDGIDIANSILGIVGAFAPYGTIIAGVISPVLNAFKESETDPMIEYLDDQFQIVNENIDNIRGDISELSSKVDASINRAVADITEQIGEEIRASEAGKNVYNFMSSGQGNFDYSLLKNYLYGAYDASNDLASTAYADKLGRLYALNADDADIEKCHVDLYRHLTTVGNERIDYVYILRQYMLENKSVRVDKTIQRDYYDWLLANKDCLDNGESPEWLALMFASDLKNTLFDAEGYMILCNQYFLFQMDDNGTDCYKFLCDDGSTFTITRIEAENKIASLKNEARDEEIRVQLAKDAAYIMNAENSFTVENINGEFYEIINHGNDNFGIVHDGQTVYMNRLPDEVCSMFGLDPQKFTFVTNTGKTSNGVFSITDQNELFLTNQVGTKTFTVNLYYGNAKIDTHSIDFSLYDSNTNNRFSGGDGTSEYPYLISAIEQMNLMEIEWEDRNNAATQLHYQLINNLDYSGKEFYPFGYDENAKDTVAFQNVFNGDGYTISNLTINANSYVGVFAKNGCHGVIKNLNIDKLNIVGKHANIYNTYVGAITGLNEGDIYNCHITDCSLELNSEKTEGEGTTKNYLGGIAGSCIENGKISFCSVNNTQLYAWSYRYYENNKDSEHKQYTYVGGITSCVENMSSVEWCTIDGNCKISAKSRTETKNHGGWLFHIGNQNYPYITTKVGGITSQSEDQQKIKNIYVGGDVLVSAEQSCENKANPGGSHTDNFSCSSETYLAVDSNNINNEIVFSNIKGTYDVDFFYDGKNNIDYAFENNSISEYQVYDYHEDFLNVAQSFEIYNCQGTTEKGKPCDWVYYEQYGCLEKFIAPETKYEQLPKDFTCPTCGASFDKLVQRISDHTEKKILTLEVTDELGRYTLDSYKILGIYNFDTDVASKEATTKHLATVLFLATMKDTQSDNKVDKILSVEIPFVVKPIQKSELRIVEKPTKLHYDSVGEEISLDGGVFELVWEDGSVEEIKDLSLIEISPKVTGENNPTTVTLTYKGISVFYDVSVFCEHDFSQTVVTEPTCAHGGKTVQICSKCDFKQIITETEKLPHSTVLHNVDSASCADGDTGYTGDLWCVKCEKYVSYGIVIPVLEHTYASEDNSKHKCSVCGYVSAHEFTSVENDDCIIYTCITCTCEPIRVEKKTDITVSRVVVGNSYGIRGLNDEIAVYVKIFENPGITGVSFRIEFDERLEFVRAERGDVLDSSQTFNVAYSSAGVIGFVAANAYVQEGDGTLVKLVFKLPADAELMERYDIDIAYTREQFTDGHANVIEMVTMGGYITAVDHLPGDVNSDNVFDMLDTVLLTRYLSIKLTSNTEALKSFITNYNFGEFYADVDLNGSVGLSDLVMMLQFLAGNNVHELTSNQFEIILNANNGNSEVESIIVQAYDENELDKKGKYPELPQPKREGYRFDGWYYSFEIKEGDEPIKAGDTVRYQSGLVKQVLYARWTEIYYVEYNPNFPDNASDCSGTMDRSEFEYEKQETLANNGYNVTGWTFKGWALSPDGEVVYQSGDKVQGLSHNGETFTLYGIWEVNSYTVKFSANQPDTDAYVTGSMESVKMKYDKSYTLDKSIFKLKGYEFIGWNTKADGSGTSYAVEGMVENLTSEMNGVVTLYAQWAPITYTIVYDANGGSGTMNDSTHTYDDKTSRLYANAFEKGGYIFEGWNTEPDGSGNSYGNKSLVNNMTSTSETIVLYAKWKPITYYVAYNANGGTGTTAASEHTYDKIAYLTPNGFTRIGYKFVGWTLNKDGSGDVLANNISVKNLSSVQDAEVVLYAKWEPCQYKVIYHSNLDTGILDEQNHNYDESFVIKSNEAVGLERAGYSFAGWNTQANGSGITYAAGDTTSNLATEGTIILYAQWKAHKYTIVYMGNGDDVSGNMSNSEHTYGNTEYLSPNGFNKPGYSFVGWSTAAINTTPMYQNAEKLDIVPSVDGEIITLYAQWGDKVYTVTYHSNDGSGQTASFTIRSDFDTQLMSNPFARLGWHFVGWNTMSDGSGVKYTDEQTVNNLVDSEQNINLYAQWEIVTYTIDYNLNGGEWGDLTGPSTYHISELDKMVIPEPHHSEYPYYIDFLGWYTDEACTIPFNTSTLKENPDNTSLYAKWEEYEQHYISEVKSKGSITVSDKIAIIDCRGVTPSEYAVNGTMYTSNTTKVYFIGNSGITLKEFKIGLCSFDPTKTNVYVSFDNIKMTGLIFQKDGSLDLSITLECSNANSITTSQGATAIADFSSLNLTGTGSIKFNTTYQGEGSFKLIDVAQFCCDETCSVNFKYSAENSNSDYVFYGWYCNEIEYSRDTTFEGNNATFLTNSVTSNWVRTEYSWDTGSREIYQEENYEPHIDNVPGAFDMAKLKRLGYTKFEVTVTVEWREKDNIFGRFFLLFANESIEYDRIDMNTSWTYETRTYTADINNVAPDGSFSISCDPYDTDWINDVFYLGRVSVSIKVK